MIRLMSVFIILMAHSSWAFGRPAPQPAPSCSPVPSVGFDTLIDTSFGNGGYQQGRHPEFDTHYYEDSQSNLYDFGVGYGDGIVRYSPSGQLDEQYNSNLAHSWPKNTDYFSHAPPIFLPDGSMLFLAAADNHRNDPILIERVNEKGLIDPTFEHIVDIPGTCGFELLGPHDDYVLDLEEVIISPDKSFFVRILRQDTDPSISGWEKRCWVKFLRNGTIDTSFGDHGAVTGDNLREGVAAKDGGLIFEDESSGNVVKLTSSGQFDPSFHNFSFTDTSSVRGMMLASAKSGSLYVEDCRKWREDCEITRRLANGSLDPTFLNITEARSVFFYGSFIEDQNGHLLVLTRENPYCGWSGSPTLSVYDASGRVLFTSDVSGYGIFPNNGYYPSFNVSGDSILIQMYNRGSLGLFESVKLKQITTSPN